jgi:hypothetical protein
VSAGADGIGPRVECDEAPRVRLPVVPAASWSQGRRGLIDMMDTRSGGLVVIGRAAAVPSYHGGARWLCRCDCGGETTATGSQLRGPRARTSCGHCGRSKAPDDTRARRSGPRARTLPVVRMSRRALKAGALAYSVAEHASYERPQTRGDCLAGGSNAARPCPWVSCAQHLALDVSEDNGSIKVTVPGANGEPDLDAMRDTCALDVADRGGLTLEEAGATMNLTRERLRQLEDAAQRQLKALPMTRELAGIEHVDSRGEVADSDDGSGARTDQESADELGELCYGPAVVGWVL